MEATPLQSILLSIMQVIEQKYGKEISSSVVRPLAEAFDALGKLESLLRNSKGGGV